MTAYGGELLYTVRFEPFQRSLVIDGQPDVVLQGNGIFLEHYSQIKPRPRVPQTITVTFREVRSSVLINQPDVNQHKVSVDSRFFISIPFSDSLHGAGLTDSRVPASTC